MTQRYEVQTKFIYGFENVWRTMTQRDEGHNYRDSKNRAMEYERKQKYEAIIDMVIRWLDSNIDDNLISECNCFS
jgi:hypothetical protein